MITETAVRSLLACLLLCLSPLSGFSQMNRPKTAAERTNHQETTNNRDVREFLQDVAKLSPNAKLFPFGKSHQGQPLEVISLANPAVESPEQAKSSKKPVLLVFANIHAGEVDGKEAVLMLARELATTADHPLLKEAILLLVPNLNPDGNDQFSKKNRPEQNGPPEVGIRYNGQNLDLNRDFTKLETPEIQALVKLINAWNPLLTIDCHTTNGSHHRYKLTYDGPRHPMAGQAMIDFSKNTFLPELTRRIRDKSGYETFTYGNFADKHKLWESYPSIPRFGVQYLALTGRFALLSESYSHASYEDRIKATLALIKCGVELTLEKRADLQKLREDYLKNDSALALKCKAEPEPRESSILGYVEEVKSGRTVPTANPMDYQVKVLTRVQPVQQATLPEGYLVPANFTKVIETLQRHGIILDELRETTTFDCDSAMITSIDTNEIRGSKRTIATVKVQAKPESSLVPAGTILVKTKQPLGKLAGYLLEAESEDGVVYWGMLNDVLPAPGQIFPIRRVLKLPEGLLVGEATPLAQDKPAKKPITPETLASGRGFGGGFAPIDWLPDGEHYLQARGGKYLKVNARTGKTEPFFDPELLTKSLKAIPDITPMAIDQIVKTPAFRMTSDRKATLVNLGPDLAVAYFDGTPGARLTKKGTGEFMTLSPSGKAVAYVRAGNLYSAFDSKEVQLTKDGSEDILNGKADWVYEEEIFNRNGKAYWWSPDGKAIAFMRFDDKPVAKFHLTAMTPARGRLESYGYPKTGDPNPHVQIGVVPTVGGPVQFLDLSEYKPESTVISRVGWVGKSNVPFAYVQNREQTWLDFLTWPDLKGKPVKLFRETTKAWVEDLGEPRVLSDSTMLILSERSGYKHAYHYAADGKLLKQITTGEWEIQSLVRVDEKASLLYFTATKDNPTGSHLYRIKLDGTGLERLTPAGGTHSVSLAPAGTLFVDRFTDDETPTITTIREIGSDFTRTLDSNPNKMKEEYLFGKYERVQIPMKDGFLLEAGIVYPPSFDPKKTYPVWVMTYAGPHAPTVKTGWGNGRLMEQVLAGMGIVVLRVDPRSASGKGAISAWSCYKQMGVQELKDLEEAVAWLGKNPWMDSKRVGLSGHSYGGYITAYALTHSKVFSAGISGAPVTDWRLYDTIYTERYMGLPKDNAAGYDKSSVIKAANNLHGKLLLIHGMMDDNVHIQNTAQFVDALQRANKEFEIMIYPNARHGIGGQHYQKLQLSFIAKTMGVGK
jgi:dipeptidyl-peptidase 4